MNEEQAERLVALLSRIAESLETLASTVRDGRDWDPEKRTYIQTRSEVARGS
jgi:hypothetical protein